MLLGVNPDMVPYPPAAAASSPLASVGGSAGGAGAGVGNLSYDGGWNGEEFLWGVSNESIGVGTWIASVLFCSSVCFGNIGRRLALERGMGRKWSVS